MFRFLWLAGGILIFLSSCVTNKKYVYLQNDDLKAKDLPKDTTVRVYDLDQYDYRVQPQDALYIDFESLTDEKFDFLKGQQQGVGGSGQNLVIYSELVDEEGNIDYPVVGKVSVGGLTVFEIQEKLQKLADQYLESPIVKVRITNFRFTLLGEVEQEGTITSFNNRVSIPEAIGLAGGLGDLADKSKIKLIRVKDGVTSVSYLNMLDENFMNSPYYYIHQNDVLIVPPLKQRPYREYFGQNLSLVISSVSLLLLVINLYN